MRLLPHTLQEDTTSISRSWTFVGRAVADAKALPPWGIALPIMVPPRSALHLLRGPASALSVSRAPEKNTTPPAEWYETDSRPFHAPSRRKWRQKPQCR